MASLVGQKTILQKDSEDTVSENYRNIVSVIKASLVNEDTFINNENNSHKRGYEKDKRAKREMTLDSIDSFVREGKLMGEGHKEGCLTLHFLDINVVLGIKVKSYKVLMEKGFLVV